MVDVAIIGAGPYGLSLAAHLGAAGVDFRIFGVCMDSWRRRMPPGMLLKSHPWSSSLSDPAADFTFERFCAERTIPYHRSLMSVPLETFVAYGEAFQARLVPRVEPKLLVRLEATGAGYRAQFDDGDVVAARRVVLAVGVHPFSYVPEALRGLPADRLTHSGDHGPIEGLAGRHVAVVGAGASATDLASLLLDKGAMVSLAARTDALVFAPPPRTNPSLPRRAAAPLRALVRPNSGIGAGWPLKVWADAPSVFHALPQDWRLRIVRTTLGPLGHAAMRERVLSRVDAHLGCEIESAKAAQDRVRLTLVARDGSRRALFADHVIAATGYRVDLARLGFLDPGLRARIRCAQGSPELNADYESSAPGLFFIGTAAAASFGPVNRFVFGATHPCKRLARRLSGSRSRAADVSPDGAVEATVTA
ncbi:MAG TPA: NAD(P)/FAD-dependent oxidoreductase [Phenylobacterium sp.]|uniref:NAD(P)/FAD-dependent oxidoreductase n=1 Tax=Phenylobacterium sp. TaxID=1871053 RepID=UPI002B475510|nr:NAD(P)/FAD-dependent oxidoreductase [Phenylobacterium sp.]HKR89914.1 NAD(P)/FAD-dependent oxidoreductase [Phenylobacterium sp.]